LHKGTRKPVEKTTIEFDSKFDIDFPGYQSIHIDLPYDFKISTTITSNPARDRPSYEDIPHFLQMHTKRLKYLIQCGISIRELTGAQDPESFQSLEEMSTSEGFLDPPPTESQGDPVGTDPTDVRERMDEEMQITEPVPVRSRSLSPVASTSKGLTKRGEITNIDIQLASGSKEIPWIPVFKITSPPKTNTRDVLPTGPPKKTARLLEPEPTPPTSPNKQILDKLTQFGEILQKQNAQIASHVEALGLVKELMESNAALSAEIIYLRSEISKLSAKIDMLWTRSLSVSTPESQTRKEFCLQQKPTLMKMKQPKLTLFSIMIRI
jgi:hypothetical protein